MNHITHMKIISWNVNGIRAALQKGFMNFVTEQSPDILCIQETKAQEDQVQLHMPEYHQYWHSADKKGYSGTLTLSKKKPLSVQRGMGTFFDDTEGRVLTLEFDEFFLVNTYVPNAQPELARIGFKQTWNTALEQFLTYLKTMKPVILCGDLNVAHQEIDLARPKPNIGNPGFSNEERGDFSRLLETGFIDIWREQHPDEIKYSWWSYRANARANNVGWRIDYFAVSKGFEEKIMTSEILCDVMGSDHCPVQIKIII